MGIPRIYRKEDERAIVSFDYADIISGLGIVVFDGYSSEDSVGESFHISNKATSSGDNEISTQNNGNTNSYDFDSSPFNSIQTIKGTFETIFSHGIINTSSSAGRTNAVTVAVYHYDGSTETLLGTATSPSITSVDGTNKVETRVMSYSLVQKIFGIGDILRIKVTMAWSGGGGTYLHFFTHDPLNRDFSTMNAADNPTYFKNKIPLKLDL